METLIPPIGLQVEKVGTQYELYTRYLNRPIAERAARLANAAPDLLAALERLERVAAVELAQTRPDVLEQARAAIAKAKGE